MSTKADVLALLDAAAERVRRQLATPAPATSGRRARSPAQTVEAARRHFLELGITRLGLSTGLDRLGIPVAFATRPNARSLAVSQGKGLDDDSALASAAMEAFEVAVAERQATSLWTGTLADLRETDLPMLDLARTTRCRHGRIPTGEPQDFVAGFDLVAGQPVLVPWSLVTMDHTDLGPDEPVDRSSDGLASGNNLAEAALHGVLELVERDAVALFQVRAVSDGSGAPLRTTLSAGPSRVSADLDHLLERLARDGLDVRLHDATTDIGLPCVVALLQPNEAQGPFDEVRAARCGGYACNPDPAQAAISAVLEAVQARVAGIAGARDDIGPAWYRAARDGSMSSAAPPAPLGSSSMVPPAETRIRGADSDPVADPDDSAGDQLQAIVRRLGSLGITQAVLVALESPSEDLAVVRMIVPGLEVGTGAGRHIGRRLLAAMLSGAG